MLSKYVELMKHARLGDEFVKTLSALVMVDRDRRSRQKSRSGDGDHLKAEVEPAEVPPEKISNREMLAEMAEKTDEAEPLSTGPVPVGARLEAT
jgi:hypothetical protein